MLLSQNNNDLLKVLDSQESFKVGSINPPHRGGEEEGRRYECCYQSIRVLTKSQSLFDQALSPRGVGRGREGGGSGLELGKGGMGRGG